MKEVQPILLTNTLRHHLMIVLLSLFLHFCVYCAISMYADKEFTWPDYSYIFLYMFVIVLLLGRNEEVMQKNVLVGQSYVCLEVSDLCLLKVNEAIQM